MIRHNILDIFNERIYELGIKQKYIAEKMNITQDRLSRILSGKSNMLADEMITLCALLPCKEPIPHYREITARG